MGKRLHTIITLTPEAAEAMIRKAKSETRMRLVEMMRDYGMFMLDTQAPGYKVDLPQHTRDAILSAFDRGAASATGDQGAAMSIGFGGIVSGKAGNALFLVERADDGEIIHAWAGIVGRDGIEEGAWSTSGSPGSSRAGSPGGRKEPMNPNNWRVLW